MIFAPAARLQDIPRAEEPSVSVPTHEERREEAIAAKFLKPIVQAQEVGPGNRDVPEDESLVWVQGDDSLAKIL
jgi:hypothetical protein